MRKGSFVLVVIAVALVLAAAVAVRGHRADGFRSWLITIHGGHRK